MPTTFQGIPVVVKGDIVILQWGSYSRMYTVEEFLILINQ